MKKIISLTLAIVLCFCTICVSANADIVDIAYYRDWNFDDLSAPEYVALTADADSVSFWGSCVNTPDEPESLTAFIIGVTNPLCSVALDFDADGSVTTYPYAFPQGLYRVYFVGNEDVEKAYAYAVFTKVD